MVKKQTSRVVRALLIAAVMLGLGACTENGSRKAGRAAYDVTQEAEKAAKKAGQKLKETSHDLHEGWKEAKRDAKENPKR